MIGAMPVEAHRSRSTALGGLPIWRALPLRGRRLIGPWCFLDRYGPLSFTDAKPMDVAPHPHIGIQTVSWLLEGEVVHRDSLGFEATVRPGGVNVMTSAAGIAHSEETPLRNSGRLNGVQLWMALPDAHRRGPASFQHVAEVPAIETRGGRALLIAGTHDGVQSPAAAFSDLVGLDAVVRAAETMTMPLLPGREHGFFVLEGDLDLDGQALEPNWIYYLAPGRTEAAFRSRGGGRLLVLGGTPFPEPVLMWWNFVARTPEEIAAAREDWEAERRFGVVRGYRGGRIPAPPLSRLGTPNPAS